MPYRKDRPYTGVSFVKRNLRKPFVAQINKTISPNGKNITIGLFSDYHDAAEAYNTAIIKAGISARLNKIDRSIESPYSYEFDPGTRNMVNLSVQESIALIKKNTDEKNAKDNKALIMYLSGRKDAIQYILKKYHYYWLQTIRRKNAEYKTTIKKRKRKIVELQYSDEDVISESVIKILSALSRGKFDGRKFRQWSTQIVRITMIKMFLKESARKIDKEATTCFDYEKAWSEIKVPSPPTFGNSPRNN